MPAFSVTSRDVRVAHVVAAAAYAGFQWTVHTVVYPQMRLVPPAAFVRHQEAHSRRTGRLVAPLLGALVVTSGLRLRQSGGRVPEPVAGALGAAIVVGATAVGAVPQHRVLARGRDDAALTRLLRWDAVRTAAATAVLVAAVLDLTRRR